MRVLGVQPSVAKIVGTMSSEKVPTAPRHLAQFVKKSRREYPQQPHEWISLFLVILVFIEKKLIKLHIKSVQAKIHILQIHSQQNFRKNVEFEYICEKFRE